MAAFSSRSIRWLAPLFVVGCTLAAFLNSLDGEFLMDDYCEILDNPLMESPWPPWRVMLVGHKLPSRPLPYLTFAIDHANPNPNTGTVQGLLSVIGVLALAANMFCRIKAVNWSKY